MHSLTIHLVTFNCGRALIDVDHFAAGLFKRSAGETTSPDLVVFSLQEIAPIAQSFLGGNLLLPYLARFVNTVSKASDSETRYAHVVTRNIGMTAIMLLAKEETAAKIHAIQTALVGVGLYSMGNKGAVALQIALADNTEESNAHITFVAAHLAPMENKWQRRNQDWQNIVKGLVFAPTGKHVTAESSHRTSGVGETDPLLEVGPREGVRTTRGIFCDHIPLFVAGDLNYRTSDKGPEPDAQERFPQPSEHKHKAAGDPADAGAFATLKSNDQLNRERRAGRTMQSLDELPITFPPTYKYSEKSTNHAGASSDSDEPDTWHWAKHRFPSWCDRILFSAPLSADQHTQAIFKPISYRALPLRRCSDHRPVAMQFTINPGDFASSGSPLVGVTTPFALNSHAATDRAFARKLEILVGSLAYITMTWEGNALLIALIVGALGGWLMLSSMIGI